jgi:CPA2 family monovalent cation:H+ antiporter-2
VRWIAVPGAVVQIALATLLGVGLSALWGWSVGAGLLLGLSLSVASTVVLLRALDERNLLHTSNGRIAVGWLIVEDLAMVLALVLLPAVATVLSGASASAAFDGNFALSLAITLGKVLIFVAIAVMLGPRVIPWLLMQVARTGSRELFRLSVLAVALGIAYGSAELFGVSFALGAFFAGLILSESRFSRKAAEESLPFQDAFSVLFFVSVGMLFDPLVLVHNPAAVASVLLLIVVGKPLIAFLVVLALRYPISTGLVVSVSLAQIGEFSFILLTLGLSLGLLPAEGRDLIVAGALFSITLNPLLFSLAEWAVGRSALARSGPLASIGQRRYQALERDLRAVRQRAERREQAHGIRLRALVETFPLFASLDRQEQEELLLFFRPRAASPGEKLIRAGGRGDAMYFISSGKVEVLAARQRIVLEAGEVFGEMALLTGERRSADVIALDFCQFLVLSRRDFNKFASQHPALKQSLGVKAEERREMNRRAAANSAVEDGSEPSLASPAEVEETPARDAERSIG